MVDECLEVQGSKALMPAALCASLEWKSLIAALQALHSVYYEPLASVAPSLRDLMAGSAVRKLLFMTTPEVGAGN
jgi:hypothetical protein